MRPPVMILIVVGLGVLLSVGAFLGVGNWERDALRADFARDAEDRVSVLGDVISDDLLAVRTMAAYFAGSEKVERAEFHEFVKVLLAELPGIQGLAWVARVPAAERDAFEAAALADGCPGFQITELERQGLMRRAAPRDEYFAVHFVEPHAGNEMAHGFDLASESVRRQALARARDTGELTASRNVVLVQETGTQQGVVVFMPVYRRGGGAAESVARRREDLAGFVLGVFRTGDLLASAMSRLVRGIDVTLYDASAPQESRLLATHSSRVRGPADVAPPLVETTANSPLRLARTLPVAGRQWLVLAAPTPEYVAARQTWWPWQMLAAGLVLTAALALYLTISLRRERKIKRLAGELLDANGRLEADLAERRRMQRELAAAEERYRSLIENLPIGLYRNTPGPDGRFLMANPALARMHGYDTAEELLQVAPASLHVSPERRREFSDRLLAQGKVVGEELELCRKDGTCFWGAITANVVLGPDGDVLFFDGLVEDVSERKQAEDRIRNLARFPAENPTPVLRIARDGTVMYANAASRPLLDEWGCLVGGAAPLDWQQRVRGALGQDRGETVEIRARDRVLSVMLVPVTEGGYANIYGRDVTERERADAALRQMVDELELARAAAEEANRKLEQLATTDELTGLWNRRHFLTALDRECRRAARSGSPLALAMLDLDHFKAVNDTHGHAVGDRVLAEVAAVMQSEARTTDLVARYGGEEFMILMPDTPGASAAAAAERLRRAIEAHAIPVGDQTVRVTASLGATAVEPGETPAADRLVRQADEMLYAAKQAGRNCVRTRVAVAAPAGP
ncbi:MAG: diguanylate cyclase [Planctomycetes bacterium]|nr:diguanylate cyclase [Planctomycetota bacterium]